MGSIVYVARIILSSFLSGISNSVAILNASNSDPKLEYYTLFYHFKNQSINNLFK